MQKKKLRILAALVITALVMQGVAIGSASAAGVPDTAIGKAKSQSKWTKLLARYKNDSDVRELIFVKYKGNAKADFVMYKKKFRKKTGKAYWKSIIKTTAYMGRDGIDNRYRRDMKNPTGIYTLVQAFGIPKNPGSKLPYTRLNKNLYLCNDNEENYNKLISIKKYPHSCGGEHMMDYPKEYAYGMILDHNKEQDPRQTNAIFFHCQGDRKYTSGCIAIKKSLMKKAIKNSEKGTKICIYNKATKSVGKANNADLSTRTKKPGVTYYPALVKSMTAYYLDTSTNKWKPSFRKDFSYKNAYPTKIVRTDYLAEKKEQTNFKYTFDEGLPESMKFYNEDNVKTATYKYNGKGQVTSMSGYDPLSADENSLWDISWKYDGNGLVKKMHLKNTYYPNKGVASHDEYPYNYYYASKINGLVQSQITGTNKVSNAKYVTKYNGLGLVTSMVHKTRTGKKENKGSFHYVIRDGRADVAVYYGLSNKGKEKAQMRYEFTYTKTKISTLRYAMMMNDVLGVYPSFAAMPWY